MKTPPVAFYRDDNRDQVEALGHWLCRQAGQPVPADEEHPFTGRYTQLARDKQGLSDMADLLGVRSLNTADFAGLMADALKILVARSYQAIGGNIDPLVKNLPVKDFRPTQINLLDVASAPRTAFDYLLWENGEPAPISYSTGNATAQMQSHGFLLPFTKHVFVNGDIPLITEMVAAAAARLGQVPAMLLADLINGNTGPDGDLVGDDNTVNGADLATAFGAGVAALETDHYLPAATWLVPPALKSAAAKVLTERPALNIALVSLPWLSDTAASYLLPDPQALPVFGRLSFTGTAPIPTVRHQRLSEHATFFGQAFAIELETAVAAVSTALVKLTVG